MPVNDSVIDSIQTNAQDFSRELSRLSEYCDQNYEAIVTKTIIDLFRRIVIRTPIDTGRARANWFIDLNPDADQGEYDQETIGNFTFNLKTDDLIWIFNNLEYIIPLEEGWSDQAPLGMVARSLVEFEKFLKDAISKLSDIYKTD